jgi:hypothetical protein
LNVEELKELDAQTGLLDSLLILPPAVNRLGAAGRRQAADDALAAIGAIVEGLHPTAEIDSLTELIALNASVRPEKAARLYFNLAPKARLIKAIIQMLIGTSTAYFLIERLYFNAAPHPVTCDLGGKFLTPAPAPGAAAVKPEPLNLHQLCLPPAKDILFLIASGLAAAAVIELAYTLFTDGPDEALDPLLLGLSATILFQFASLDSFQVGQSVGLLLSSFALFVLFLVRALFIDDSTVARRSGFIAATRRSLGKLIGRRR